MVKMMSQDKMIGKRENLSSSPSPWFSRFLRTMLLLLMMTVGGNVARADDYVGFWYINNQRLPDKGYYFVPTINCFYDGDEDKPHLTTFKTGKDKNSIWRIESVPVGSDTYYRIIHNATGKYLMANVGIPELANNSQKAAHRKRVHLETLSAQDLESLNDNPGTDKSLFEFKEIDADNLIIAIKSKNVGSSTTGEGTDHIYINPRGNGATEFDSYRAANGRAITNVDGIVGFWGNDTKDQPSIANQPGSCWKLETATSTCANPVIQYTDASTIQISYPIALDTGWTIYYTKDGSDPSDNTNINRTEITSTTTISATGVSKVRAIATKTGWDPSDEAVLIASGVPQMIQSKECDAFYMVPPIVDGDLAYATTTNIPNAKMGWNFVPAGLYCGIQYYNIINAETDKYLYCSGNNGNDNALTMVSSSDISTQEQIDRSKFRLIVQSDGSYKVISKWWAAEKPDKYYVNKKNGNNGGNAINLAEGTDNTGLWNVIAAPSSPKTQFDASFASSSSTAHFYQIQSATDNTYHVLPPTASGEKATANTTGANPAWFFYPVDDNDTWIPYYHIRNSKTGEYLYYESGSNSGFYTSTTVDSNNKDRYMFIVVKSAYTTSPVHYNIIPKALKDQAKQVNNSLNRNGTTLRILDSRNKAESNWKLEEVALFCNDPVFTETDGAISISCIPDITRIYYTTDGSTPNPNDENQRYTNNTSFSASDKLCIKAISTVSNESPSASSAVITLLNKPDVTLAGGPYTYKAADWEPSVTLSVGTTQTTTGFSTTYANQKNAGTANVTITDNEASDAWYIWNVPETEFTIDRKAVTITAKDASKVYDGAELKESDFTHSDLEAGDTHSFTVVMTTESTITNIGTQSNVIATVDGVAVTTGEQTAVGNYLVTTANGTLTVTAKAVTITAKDASKAYNGSALTEDGFEASALEASDTHTFIVVMTEGSTITNVGTQSNVIATVDGVAVTTGTEKTVGNYLVTTADGTLEVTAKEVTITAKDASKAYDGSPLTEGGFTTTVLEDGDTHTFTVAMTEGSTITNVGNTPNEIATVDGVTVTTGTQTAIGNYFVTTANGTLTVNPASVTLTANSRNTDVYDGTVKTVTGFTCKVGELTVEGLTFAESVTASGSGTDAGDYVVTVTGVTLNETKDNTGNYVVTGTTNGTLTINPLTVEITWVGTDFAYTYNGNSQAPTATASGTINDEEVIVTIIPSAQDGSSLSEEKAVNVGSYIAKATALSNSNYTLYKNNSSTGDFIDNIEQAFTIVPAELTAVTIDQTELIYNGSEQTVTVTSVKAGELNVTDVDYVVSGNAQTNANAVGESYTVIVKAKENTTEPLYVNNFTGEVTTTFTIQPKPIGVGDDDVRPLASGFSVSVGEGNTIILKDGETPLTENIDYTVGVAESSASGRYSVRKITGQGNYGSFTNVRNAIVHFMNDGNGGSVYSATFLAEPAGAVAADDTKGHALPDGITAYIITAIDGNTANAVPLEYIPEGVPVLLLSNANVSGFLVEDATVTEEQKITDAQKTANMLEEVKTGMAGFVSDTEDSNYQKAHFNVKTIYLLYMNEFVYNMEGYLAKGKVYLNPNHPNDPSTASTSPSPARRLMIKWDEDNGIDTSHLSPLSSQLPDTWYSIDGRRLSGKPTRKGLYLKNGQKIVVR